MTESEFRETVLQLVASPVDGLSFEDKAAIVRDAVTPKPVMATVAAKVHGFRNALLCGLGVVALAGGAAVTVSLTWGVPLPYAVVGSLLALLGVVGVVLLGSWLRGRKSSGPVLLDLGPNRMRDNFRKVARSMGVLALLAGIAFWPIEPAFAIVLGGALGLSALFCFFMGNGRLQVRENGLWVYWSLLRWEKIGSWRWEGDSALWVNTRGFFSWFQSSLPIAPGQRQEMHELLLKYCSALAPPNEALQPTGAASDGFSGSTSLGSGPGG
jgi:hypothetical protein